MWPRSNAERRHHGRKVGREVFVVEKAQRQRRRTGGEVFAEVWRSRNPRSRIDRLGMSLYVRSMSTPNRFQTLVQDAKTRITEVSAADAAREVAQGALLIDVREEADWQEGHAPGARHLSRGVVELEIEEIAPALDAPIICHCGGGSRSALVADSLQKMGYTNVKSLAGGFKAWKAAGLPVEQGAGASSS